METDPFSNFFLDEDDCVTNNENTPNTDTKEESDTSVLLTGDLEKQRQKRTKTTYKKTHKSSGVSTSEGLEGNNGKKEYENGKKKANTYPNYLVAIQISNPKIQAAIQLVQEHTISQNERLKPALSKPGSLHITMFMVHLATDDEITRAKHALDQCQQKLEKFYQGQILYLDVCGLGNFRNSVIFAKVKPGDQEAKLKVIADIVEDCFLDQKLKSTLKSDFTPHITIMNLSKDYQFKKRGIRKIDEDLYKDFIDAEFGCQSTNTLQLCPMLKQKTESGYYQVEYSVQFGPDIEMT